MAGVIFSLWWSKVLARGWGTRAGSTSLLDTQSTALNDFTLKTLLGSIGLVSGNHLDKAKATGLLGMGIKHDLALLNVTVLLKETSNLDFSEARMDTSNKEIRSGVNSTIILRRTTVTLSRTAALSGAVAIGAGRTAGTTTRAVIATGWARRCAAITLVSWSLVIVTGTILVLIVHRSHDEGLVDGKMRLKGV
jgi:hypothetical protein